MYHGYCNPLDTFKGDLLKDPTFDDLVFLGYTNYL